MQRAIRPGDKLYLVTRGDLSEGQQAVQAAHSLSEMAVAFPGVHTSWYRGSGFLAMLAARDEAHLKRILGMAELRGIPVAPFREPDLGGALTAVALAPWGRSLVRDLPLALKK